ncbi:ParB/RepB/Spo0J family partition protein [Pseudoduganella lurida]|uniref:ParB/RepB/Spo0J family partition protein n=1 Tax=Pseudoduganella lurida TaxID=1036180 RepID=A0A562R9V5_9BURK|nr:ParB/RepB/Spo0J family partition protein [Pseudoduganella lurida]TWI65190.1 ParB/RepB/Spo0J family partition protein [Pseudoduganella lurida]
MTTLTFLPAPVVSLSDAPIIVDELVLADGSSFGKFSLGHIRISATNRKRFNLEALQQLADSIRDKGVAQPILIRPVEPTDDAMQRYEIVAGERRFRASIMAGASYIPAICKQLSDHDAIELQILENLQREDPHPLEEAEGYERLMLTHSYTPDQLAERLKKSRSYIYGRLKLCALAKPLREQFYEEKFNAAVAELIARLPTPEMQKAAAADLTKPDWSGETMSFRRAKELLRSNYTVDLKGAAFSIKDANLVERAGPCTTCPKRAGNQPDYEGDPKAGNVCTLPSCYREKEAAHAAKTRQAAEAKGVTVVSGEDAKKIVANSYGSLRKGYADVDASFYVKGGGSTTYRKLLGKRTPTDTVVESPFDKKKLITVAKVEVLEELVREVAGAEIETEASRAAKDRAREKQQEKDAALERQYRRDLFVAVRDASPASPAIDYREVAALLYGNCPNTDVDFIRKLYGWAGKEYEGNHTGGKWRSTTAIISEQIHVMPIDQVHQLIHDMLLVRDLTVNTYTGQGETPTRLLDAAAARGVDSRAIRKRLVDEQKAKEAAKAKKAQPKKVKPAQAEIPDVEPVQPVAETTPAPTEPPEPLMLALADADTLHAFIAANRDRLNDLTPLVIKNAPHLVKSLDVFGHETGYIWRENEWHAPEPTTLPAADVRPFPTSTREGQAEVARKTLSLKHRKPDVAGSTETTGPIVRTKKPARTVVIGAVAHTAPEGGE